MDAKQFVRELVVAFPPFGESRYDKGVNGGDLVDFLDDKRFAILFNEAKLEWFSERLVALHGLLSVSLTVEVQNQGALAIEHGGFLFCIGRRWDDDEGGEIWEADVYTADDRRDSVEDRKLCRYYESDKRVAEIIEAYVYEAASRFNAQREASKKAAEPAKVDPLDRALAELQNAQIQLAAFIENGRAKYGELIASIQKQIDEIKDYQLRSKATHFALRSSDGLWARIEMSEAYLTEELEYRHEWPSAVPSEATRREWSRNLGVELSIVPINK